MSASGLKAIITGGNTGLGLHTLKRLCISGAFDYIIGIGRDVQKCEKAFNEINSLGQTNTNVELIECDLTRIQCVKEFVSTVVTRMPKIDLLILNAGVMDAPAVYVDGVEIHFASNHLGHFLLTKMLLPHLAQDSRILNITSGLYTKCTKLPTWETVHEPSGMSPRLYYAQSKLANCLFTFALNAHIKANQEHLPNIKVVAIRPGFIRGTELGRYHNNFLRVLATPLMYLFSRDIDFGTDTIIHLALVAPFEEIESGKLYFDKKVEDYTPLVNEENAEQLWQLSERLLETIDKPPEQPVPPANKAVELS